MQWNALNIQQPRTVTLRSGESLRTVVSFQGSDGDHDIVRAHIALDGRDVVLLTEFEDASGNRLLGRTTQWPIDILAASEDLFAALQGAKILAETKADGATTLENLMAGLKFDEEDVRAVSGIGDVQLGNTEMHPEEAKTGGSGDPVAPAMPLEGDGIAGDEPLIFDPAKMRMVGAEELVREGKLTRGQADEAYRRVGSEPPSA